MDLREIGSWVRCANWFGNFRLVFTRPGPNSIGTENKFRVCSIGHDGIDGQANLAFFSYDDSKNTGVIIFCLIKRRFLAIRNFISEKNCQ